MTKQESTKAHSSSTASTCTISTANSNSNSNSSKNTILSDLRSILTSDERRSSYTRSIHERICWNEVEHRLRGISLTGNSRDDAELEEIFDKAYRGAVNEVVETDETGHRCGHHHERGLDTAVAAVGSCSDTGLLVPLSNCCHLQEQDELYWSESKSRKMKKLERLRAARKRISESMSLDHDRSNGNNSNRLLDNSDLSHSAYSSERQKLLAGLGI